MSISEPAVCDLPPGYQNCSTLVLALLRQVEDIAAYAGTDELAYLAWRANKTSNNLCFAASEAGQIQRQRLAEQPVNADYSPAYPEDEPCTHAYAPPCAA